MASLSEIVLSKSFEGDQALNSFQKTLGSGLKAAALAQDMAKVQAETEKTKGELNFAKLNQVTNRIKVIASTPNERLRKAMIEDLKKVYPKLGLGEMSPTQEAHFADEGFRAKVQKLLPLYKKRLLDLGYQENEAQGIVDVLNDADAPRILDSIEKQLTETGSAIEEAKKQKTKRQKDISTRGDKLNKEAFQRFKKPMQAKRALRDASTALNDLNAVIDNPALLNSEEMRTKFSRLSISLARAAQPGALSDRDLNPFTSAAGFRGLLMTLSNALVTPQVDAGKVKALTGEVFTIAKALDDHSSTIGRQFLSQIPTGDLEPEEIEELERRANVGEFTTPTLHGEFAIKGFEPTTSRGQGHTAGRKSAVEIIKNAPTPEAALEQLKKAQPTMFEDGGPTNIMDTINKIRQPQSVAPPTQQPQEGAQLGTQDLINRQNASLGQ